VGWAAEQLAATQDGTASRDSDASEDGEAGPRGPAGGFQIRPQYTPYDDAVFKDNEFVQAILAHCATQPRTQRQLAKLTGRAFESLTPVMAALYATEKIVNIGTNEHPRWLRKLGDRSSSAELMAVIRCLCTEAPRSLQDLKDLTGARESRVNGQRNEIAREDADSIIHFGRRTGGRWLIMPEELREQIQRQVEEKRGKR
jgi:hypothetical protein